MFTGLVQAIGKIEAVRPIQEGVEITVLSIELARETKVDDSIAINGVCQTAIKSDGSRIVVQAVNTTLQKTNLSEICAGDEVNLELALKLSDRLGGHLVQGHVNEVGKIRNIENLGNNYLVEIEYPSELSPYFITEGSVAINGVSLTISHLEKEKNTLTISVIPHTWENTLFVRRKRATGST